MVTSFKPVVGITGRTVSVQFGSEIKKGKLIFSTIYLMETLSRATQTSSFHAGYNSLVCYFKSGALNSLSTDHFGLNSSV